MRGTLTPCCARVATADRLSATSPTRHRTTPSSRSPRSGVRGDGRPSRQHITDARKELQRHLDAVNAVMGDGAGGVWREGATGRVYDRTPARWRVERDLLGAAPDRPAPRLDVPRTGADLRAWREARKLSQRDAAEVLGVSERTIRSAEKAASALLPRSFRNAEWEARRALEAPARAALKARNPPVEGGGAGADDSDD